MVLWDRIIRRGDAAILDMRSATTKYNFFDDGRGLKSVHIFLCLSSYSISHLQGEPEHNFASVMECSSNCRSFATDWVISVLSPIPQLLLDNFSHHKTYCTVIKMTCYCGCVCMVVVCCLSGEVSALVEENVARLTGSSSLELLGISQTKVVLYFMGLYFLWENGH